MNINNLVKEFPCDSTFYTIREGVRSKWVEEHIVYGYRINNDEVYLLDADNTIDCEAYPIANCFKSKEEAKKLLPPMDIKTKVAVDDHGRIIDYAIFESDHVEEVPINYATHVEHCCVIHGCKYGDSDCPVANAQILQKYLCQECTELNVNWNSLHTAFTHLKKILSLK